MRAGRGRCRCSTPPAYATPTAPAAPAASRASRAAGRRTRRRSWRREPRILADLIWPALHTLNSLSSVAAQLVIRYKDTVTSMLIAVQSHNHWIPVHLSCRYRAALQEYRALQEELTPWTQAFEERHGRKPRLVDVERTGADTTFRQWPLRSDNPFCCTFVCPPEWT